MSKLDKIQVQVKQPLSVSEVGDVLTANLSEWAKMQIRSIMHDMVSEVCNETRYDKVEERLHREINRL